MSSSSRDAETNQRLDDLKALVLLPRNGNMHTQIWDPKLSASDLQYTLRFASDGFRKAVKTQLAVLEKMVRKLEDVRASAEKVLHDMQTSSRDSMRSNICALVLNRWLMEELTAMIEREQYGNRPQRSH